MHVFLYRRFNKGKERISHLVVIRRFYGKEPTPRTKPEITPKPLALL